MSYPPTADAPLSTRALVATLQAADQDFEWYPTTDAMIDAVLRDLGRNAEYGPVRYSSFLDIGAGDGRTLIRFAQAFEGTKLYSIEKSAILQQRQPDEIIPVGAEFLEQDLMSLPVAVVFCNPPFSVFEEWAERIIATAHAERLYLVMPQRWEASEALKAALKRREASARIILRSDFMTADREAKPSGWDWERRVPSVVHVVCVTFEGFDRGYGRNNKQDPFDLWFDETYTAFDQPEEIGPDEEQRSVARVYELNNIPAMVAAYNDEYAVLERNFRTIFQLDARLLKEVGVDKHNVREALKKRMQGLRNTYWQGLFQRLDALTSRLTTKTKQGFLARLTGQTSIAFTEANCYAVVIWAIKAANKYYDAQVTEVFRELSTHDGVMNYKSNQRTWGRDEWRYSRHDDSKPRPSHYALDYRIVLKHFRAIKSGDTFGMWDYPGNLHTSCHEVLDDLIAVFGNLGFLVQDIPSRVRVWYGNQRQEFRQSDGAVIFEVRAFQNGNLHFRFDQRAIKALNIEAGRLLGWLRGPADVVEELGYSEEEAAQFFGINRQLGGNALRMLTAAPEAVSA